MKKDTLNQILLALIDECGIKRVESALVDFGKEFGNEKRPKVVPRKGVIRSGQCEVISRDEKPKKSALAYVGNMELQKNHRKVVECFARRYDEKEFLPALRDIREFFEENGIQAPASLSRKSAIPRLFRWLSGMSVEDLNEIIQRQSFAGLLRLDPISDALERRAKRNTG